MRTRPIPGAAEGMPKAAASLDDLLVAFVEQERERQRLSRAQSTANHGMPEWAQAGPRMLMGDGSLSTSWSGWPRLEEMPAPSGNSISHVIRPNIAEVWKSHTAVLGPNRSLVYRDDGTVESFPMSDAGRAHRRSVRLAAFRAVRKTIVRIRRQHEERQKAGLPQLEAAYDAGSDRLFELDDSIRALATGVEPSHLAAHALMEARFMGSTRSLDQQDEAIDWLRKVLLARLAPHLTGVLRLLVDDYANGDGTRTFPETLIGGGLPEGVDVVDLAGRAYVEGIAA